MRELPDVKLLLETELDALRTHMTYVTEMPHKNVAAIDLFDGAQTVEHHEFVALSTSRLARRAREVRSALESLREGNYGVCEGCRNPIPARRLAAVPTATTCVACQFELEQRQRENSHPSSSAKRHRSSAVRAHGEDGIATRTSSIADMSRVA
jgi:RNA polymerase-binding transcription factor DksA